MMLVVEPVLRSVDQKIVRLGALSVDCITLICARRATRFEQAGRQRNNAGPKNAELRKIASVERKVENLIPHDRLAQTADAVLHQRGVGLYIDLLRLRANLQVHEHGGSLIHIQRDPFPDVLDETLRGDLEPIVSDRKFDQHVVAVRVRGGSARQSRLDLRGCDGG